LGWAGVRGGRFLYFGEVDEIGMGSREEERRVDTQDTRAEGVNM
jgi:hypothetical protein